MATQVDGHGETAHRRRLPEVNELLQELRVALPGVLVLAWLWFVLPLKARGTGNLNAGARRHRAQLAVRAHDAVHGKVYVPDGGQSP